jgi:hypothetical protein
MAVGRRDGLLLAFVPLLGILWSSAGSATAQLTPFAASPCDGGALAVLSGDGGAYRCDDTLSEWAFPQHALERAKFELEDTTSLSAFNLSAGSSANVSLGGMNFELFNNTFAAVTIHTSGRLVFSAGTLLSSPPLSQGLFVVSGMVTDATKNTSRLLFGTVGTGSARRFVVHFEDFVVTEHPLVPVTFQIVLYEGSSKMVRVHIVSAATVESIPNQVGLSAEGSSNFFTWATASGPTLPPARSIANTSITFAVAPCAAPLTPCWSSLTNATCAANCTCAAAETQCGSRGPCLPCITDGVFCTTDGFDKRTCTCQATPSDSFCQSDLPGLLCTVDSCHPTLDCQNTRNNSNCDDGVACTEDICEADGNCDNIPRSSRCSNLNVCQPMVCEKRGSYGCYGSRNPAHFSSNTTCFCLDDSFPDCIDLTKNFWWTAGGGLCCFPCLFEHATDCD